MDVNKEEAQEVVDQGLAGDAETQEIPQEVLDAIAALPNDAVVSNSTIPSPAMVAEVEQAKEATQHLVDVVPNNKVAKKERSLEDFKIYRDKTFSLWHIKPNNGQTPVYLNGTYTEHQLAVNAITAYLIKVKQDVADALVNKTLVV